MMGMSHHDNYYTGLAPMAHVANNGIYSLWTVRRNRLPNCKLPTEETSKNAIYCGSHSYVVAVDGVDICSLIWTDSKCATFISFVGKIQ